GNIIRKALSFPTQVIAENAGLEGSVVVAKIKDGEGNYGLNAESIEYEDLIEAGIIDPTKVVRSALQNAASVAGLLLTTEAIVTEIAEEPAPAAADPHQYHHH
ncbi:MAG: TCP-1/cpn60 chaperonin family protein, partial [Candidatus Poribacteria bacterium]